VIANILRWSTRALLVLLLLAVAVVAAFRLAAALRETGVRTALAPSTGHLVSTGSGGTFVQEKGPADGVPVVLFHGTAAWSELWRGTIDALASAGFRVIALDLPPFGFSDRPGSYTRNDQAARVNDVLAQLRTTPAIIVGHSFGAGAATEFAMRYQERARALVLVDAALGLTAPASDPPFHSRDAAGWESLHPDDTAGAIEAIRASVPGIPVGVSTGWWIAPRGRARQQHVRAWQVLPDYVSVNLIEEDSGEVIELVLEKGIGVEAGLWSVRDAEKFVAVPNARNCLRVLIEINEKDFLAGTEAVRQIVEILDRADIRLPRLLHGSETTMWPFYREALRLGLDARIGLEDGKMLPSGAEAEDNAALIRAARALMG
jgi:pimeloyl-ACP methyl ester carboxylesterase